MSKEKPNIVDKLLANFGYFKPEQSELDFEKMKEETMEEIISLIEARSFPSLNDESDSLTATTPAGRVSVSEYQGSELFREFVTPEIAMDFIPLIRKLVRTNENVGSVYNDLIQLTNTGHSIKFGQDIAPEIADKMKAHLEIKRDNWGSGVHGIDGLINKWIGQIYVSGALSNEWIPNKSLSGVLNNAMVNPENIRFKYNASISRYEPYQIVKNKILSKVPDNAIKLNTNTYVYSGILGDTDSPYGIPPFLTALESVNDKKEMRKNIRHILKQLGILGYLEAKLAKPEKLGGESKGAYQLRLQSFLLEAKKNILQGFSDGIVVGYDEDHEFTFNSTTKNLSGVSELYNQNEVSMANGLKTSPSLLGQAGAGTENNMSIVFTKMISQLNNIQQILSQNLKIGYLLELRLAGFDTRKVDISIEWETSTITDNVKTWQAKEIKQRVTKALFIDGIIGKDTYAEINGWKKPFSTEPVIPYKEQNGKAIDPEKKGARNEVKKKSDRKSRDKKKDQPKKKEQSTKER